MAKGSKSRTAYEGLAIWRGIKRVELSAVCLLLGVRRMMKATWFNDIYMLAGSKGPPRVLPCQHKKTHACVSSMPPFVSKFPRLTGDATGLWVFMVGEVTPAVQVRWLCSANPGEQ